MKLREFARNMFEELQNITVSMFDTDTSLSHEGITDAFEIVDDFKPILIESDDNNGHLIKLRCDDNFSIDMCSSAFPWMYAPRRVFEMKVRTKLLKMGFIKMYYTSLVMQCSRKLRTNNTGERMKMMLSPIEDALMDNNPGMLDLILTTDWSGLSLAMYKSTELFTSLDEFFAYGYAETRWISEYMSVEFEGLLEFCNKNNNIECIPILLDWKKKNIPDGEEDISL